MNNTALHFISSRLMRSRHLPRSLRMMHGIVLLGLTLGVAALLVALSIARGFEKEYKRSLLDFNAHIVLLHTGTPETELSLPPLEGIKGSAPFLYREGMIIAKGAIKGVVLKGIDPLRFPSLSQMRIEGLEQIASQATVPRIILGSALAEQLNVGAGEEIKLLVPTSRQADHIETLHVVGVFRSGLHDYDAYFAFMEIDALRKLFNTKSDLITGWEMSLDDPDRARTLVPLLKGELEPSYEVLGWYDLNRELFEALALEKGMLLLLMGTLLIVAAFNLIALFIMMVLFCGKEFAILAALGFSRKKLMRLMILRGVKLGALGSGVGIALGVAVGFLLQRSTLVPIDPEIYFLTRLPLDISPLLCGIIAAFCLVVCWGVSSVAAQYLLTRPISWGLRQSRS